MVAMKEKVWMAVMRPPHFHSRLSVLGDSWLHVFVSCIVSLVLCSGYIPQANCYSPSSFSSSSILLSLEPKTFPKRQHVFDLSDFGAVGDGVTDNTRVFQNALYAVSGVADKGGGQLYVPPGRYVTGSFNLTNNMTLYLARDAVILGSLNTSKWPVIAPLPSYGRGRELPGPRHSSLLYGQNLVDVVITGENGTIDGQGFVWWEMVGNNTLEYTRGSLIEVLWTRNLVLANITLINSPYWTFHPTYCRDVLIIDVTISSPDDSPGVDGIDPDSCSHVLIENVAISTGSDSISIKSGWDEYGISFAMPSTNILIKNIVLRSAYRSAFSIGSEMSGGVENVTLVDAVIQESRVGILIETSQGRGGYISEVNVSNVTMTGVDTAIKFLPDSIGQHPDTKFNVDAWPVVQGLLIKDSAGTDIGRAGELDGFANSIFADIFLSNITFKLRPGGVGFTCAFVVGCATDVTPEPCPQLKPKNDSFLQEGVCGGRVIEGR